MDGWLTSDDFIPRWLAVALLTNANCSLRLSDCYEFGQLLMWQTSKTLNFCFKIKVWCCIAACVLFESCSLHFCLSSCCSINYFLGFVLEIKTFSITATQHILQNIHKDKTNLIPWHITAMSEQKLLFFNWQSTGKRMNVVILLYM